jgi:hypothetical protein
MSVTKIGNRDEGGAVRSSVKYFARRRFTSISSRLEVVR